VPLGYCSFQKTGDCWALIDDSGKTIAHVHGLRHLKLFRFAWDTRETLKAVEKLCASDPANPTVAKIKLKLAELTLKQEKAP